MVPLLDKIKRLFAESRNYEISVSPQAQEQLDQYKLHDIRLLLKNAIALCDELKRGIQYPLLQSLNISVNLYLSCIPAAHYHYHEELVNAINDLILESLEQGNFSDQEFHVLFMQWTNNYGELAGHFAMMANPGKAYHYVNLTLLSPSPIVSDPYLVWEKAIEEYQIVYAREIVLSLFANYFYISRNLAHNANECHSNYKAVVKWLKTGDDAVYEDIMFMCYYAGIIAIRLPDDQDTPAFVLQFLKEQYEIQRVKNPELSKRIAETLSTKFAQIMGESIFEWTKKAMAGSAINPQAAFTLNVNALLEQSEGLGQHEQLRSCIFDFLEYLETVDPFCNELQRLRLSEYVNRIIFAALEQGNDAFAAECAYIWRTYRAGEYRLPDFQDEVLLVVVPTFYPDKILYLIRHKETTKRHAFDRDLSLNELLDQKNKFEGTSTIIAGESLKGEATGQLEPFMSDQYEAALERFYHPQAIANELIRFQDKKIRMLEVTWQNVPLASLIGKHHSLSLSTLATHERNERAAFRKILIWCDPLQDLRTSSYEKESIETICRAHNIRCESVSGDECTVDGFLHKYADEEYDLIWVICHGNFDYDDYFNSELVVSRHGAVTLEQVKRLTPAGSKRRLLVLNSCQSACSTVRYDGMGFVGFGTQLANQAQSVIGHLWPVSQMAASIFGAVLMGNLVLQSSWEAALNKTRKDLVNPLSSARSLLSGYLPENNKLIQELEEHSTLLSKLFFWGSASLFE